MLNTPYKGPQRSELPALTGLRFFAALSVLAYHFSINNGGALPEVVQRIASRGAVGVILFFVLSGFVLAYRYEGHLTHVPKYALARFARIYPLYLLSLLVGLPDFVARAQANLVERAPAPLVGFSEMAMLHAWGPWALDGMNPAGWSLSVEVLFYAVFPLLLPIMERWTSRQLLIRVVLCWSLIMLMQIGLDLLQTALLSDSHRYWLSTIATFHPLANVPHFLIGVTAGLLFVRRPVARLVQPRDDRALVFVAEILVAALILLALATAVTPDVLLRNGLLSPLFAVLIVLLGRNSGLLAKILGLSPLRLLGNASYALYLLQDPLFRLAQALLHELPFVSASPLLGLLFTLAVMLWCSICLYWLVELPMRNALVWFFSLRRPLRASRVQA